jgi:hypothetical protein
MFDCLPAECLEAKDSQSIIQLIAGLNAGYAALKSLSERKFDRYQSLLAADRSRRPTRSTPERRIPVEKFAENARTNQIKWLMERSDRHAHIICFFMFLAYSVLLQIHTVVKFDTPQIYIWVIFIVGMAPLVLLVGLDIYVGRLVDKLIREKSLQPPASGGDI